MSEDRYRLVVLGSAKVGKTSIIRRYLYNEFSEKYKETIEDLHSREFRIQGVPLNLDILDTNFNFPDMRRIAINSASAFMLVFSVDDVTSFKEMSEIWQEICDRRTDLNALPVVVVGNKAELPTKKIYEATATAFTSRLSSNVRYLEASARTCLNIVEVFRTLLELSGFPRCKAGGGSLDDTEEEQGGERNTTLRRNNTTRNRPLNRDFKEGKVIPLLDKQTSNPSLSVPLISDMRRNRSFKAPKSARSDKQFEIPEEGKLTRSSSLIRRTKHLSLKIRRSGGEKNGEEVKQDDSDCHIQ